MANKSRVAKVTAKDLKAPPNKSKGGEFLGGATRADGLRQFTGVVADTEAWHPGWKGHRLGPASASALRPRHRWRPQAARLHRGRAAILAIKPFR